MSTPSLIDDGKRPISMGKAYCFSEWSEQTFNLLSNKYNNKPEYECTSCGHKTQGPLVR